MRRNPRRVPSPTKKAERPRREPATARDWHRLMQKVIARARQLKDRREPGLQSAINQGAIPQTLKRMGIICETDIRREFPDP